MKRIKRLRKARRKRREFILFEYRRIKWLLRNVFIEQMLIIEPNSHEETAARFLRFKNKKDILFVDRNANPKYPSYYHKIRWK